MSVEEIYAVLSAALPGIPIEPTILTLPEGYTGAYATYTVAAITPDLDLEGDSRFDGLRVQVDVVSATLLDCQAKSEAVRAAMLGVKGVLVSGFSDADPDTRMHRMSRDYSVRLMALGGKP